MKKFFAIIIVTLSVNAALAAQTRWPAINKYADIFMGQFVPAGRDWKSAELGDTDPAVNEKYAALEGNAAYLDTALEVVLYVWYSGSTNTVPPEADALLPRGNPKQGDTQLGALVYKRIVESRFLANTAAAGKYEEILRVITGRGNVSRAEIEAYYRQGIAGLVAEAVDEEFNKISFLLDKTAQISYGAVLTRNARNQYILSYEDAKYVTKELSAPSLEALLVEMARNRTDFSQTSIDQVRTQAALIPAVVYADWQRRGVAQGTDALALVKETLTKFYLNPNRDTYNAILGIYARYRNNIYNRQDIFAGLASKALKQSIITLNAVLGQKTETDAYAASISTYVNIPNDPRYNVFSTRYE